jgi:hypothetical protein
MQMKLKILTIALLSILILILGINLFTISNPGEKPFDPNDIRAGVISKIENKGFINAYKEIKKDANGSYEVGHLSLHIFGEELYEEEGVSGIAICDDSFGYGCYHGFLLRGFSDSGLDFIDEAESICVNDKNIKSVTACEHGMGHGILDYLGHDKLLQALKTCSRLSWKEKLYGCQDGIFMEYNFPSLIQGGEIRTGPREINVNEPYAPCNEISDDFSQACFFSLPQLWYTTISEDFSALGLLCDKVKDADERRACYYGIGNIVPFSNNMDVDVSIDICNGMKSPEGNLGCRIFAARSYYSMPDLRQNYKKMCQSEAEEGVAAECLRVLEINH